MPPEDSQRGTAAVEFALVFPLVLVLALALVQVGLFTRDRLLVEAAARAAVRAAAVTDDLPEIDAAAAAAAPALATERLEVVVERSGTRGDPVTVRIEYDDPVRVPLVSWLTGHSVVMRASAAARQEFT
jgi:Flp pilus assembly protein TadG